MSASRVRTAKFAYASDSGPLSRDFAEASSADSVPNGNGISFGNNTAQSNAFQGMHVDMSPFAGGTNRGWLNNSSVYSAANTATTLNSTNFPATPTIGRYGGNYNYFTGRVYYLIAYNGSQPDHTTMYNYLSAKYKYT